MNLRCTRHGSLGAMLRRSVCVFAGGLYCLNPVWAQSTDDSEALFQMDLKDLLMVSVASAKPERLTETPGIVSRYEMREMERLGLHRLVDVLRFIPGVTVQRAINGTTNVHIRGLMDSTNQKVLFLLNDTPVWSSSHADIPLFGIPTEVISHIEVIRGPGSVLYGTNASAGVIKVVTRDDEDSSFLLQAGSHQQRSASTYWATRANDLKLRLSAEIQASEGYPAQVNDSLEFNGMGFSNTGSGKFRTGERTKSVYLDMEKQNTRVALHAFETVADASAFSVLAEHSEYIQRSFLLGLTHKWRISDWQFKGFSEYNQYQRLLKVDDLLSVVGASGSPAVFRVDEGGQENYRWRNGVHAAIDVSEELGFIAGLEFEDRSTGDYRLSDSVNGTDVAAISPGGLPPGETTAKIFPENSAYELSEFLQLDYRKDKWRWVAGIRYTDNENYGAKTTPRLSVLYQLSERDSLKLLYSEGFNTPTFSQDRDVDSFGNPVSSDLEAEEVSTSELAYSFDDGVRLFIANAFYTEIKRLIGFDPSTNGVPGNADSTLYRAGLELDYQYREGDWKVFLNGAWLAQGDMQGSKDALARISPEYTFSTGFSHALNESQSLGFSHHWLSARAGFSPAYVVNASYSYRHQENEAFVSIKNLTDRENAEPDGSFSADNSFQNFDRINVQLGFRHHF